MGDSVLLIDATGRIAGWTAAAAASLDAAGLTPALGQPAGELAAAFPVAQLRRG